MNEKIGAARVLRISTECDQRNCRRPGVSLVSYEIRFSGTYINLPPMQYSVGNVSSTISSYISFASSFVPPFFSRFLSSNFPFISL